MERAGIAFVGDRSAMAMGKQLSPHPNPPNGAKQGIRKITVTLPQQAYQQLIQESARRKIAGEPNQLLSSLLREAVADYLARTPRQAAEALLTGPASGATAYDGD
jgi:transcriptional regulator of met regulon